MSKPSTSIGTCSFGTSAWIKCERETCHGPVFEIDRIGFGLLEFVSCQPVPSPRTAQAASGSDIVFEHIGPRGMRYSLLLVQMSGTVAAMKMLLAYCQRELLVGPSDPAIFRWQRLRLASRSCGIILPPPNVGCILSRSSIVVRIG